MRLVVLLCSFIVTDAYVQSRLSWVKQPLTLKATESDAAFGDSRKDSYNSLETVLATKCADKTLAALVIEMTNACAQITEVLHTALITIEGNSYSFGDLQLTVDVIVDELLWQMCMDSSTVMAGASKEGLEMKPTGRGQYYAVWNALDDSSVVDESWALGTTIGVWNTSTGPLGTTGRDQVTSLVALYGSWTTVIVKLDDGVYEFIYGSNKTWLCSRERIQISPECELFSSANMQITSVIDGYRTLREHYRRNNSGLRYTSALPAEAYQEFRGKKGVFSTIGSSPAELFLAFWVAPFALLVEAVRKLP